MPYNPQAMDAARAKCGFPSAAEIRYSKRWLLGELGMTRIAQVRLSIPQLLWVGAQNPLIMRELFGDAWVDHFTVTREWEAKCYKEHKKDDPDWYWMRDRYFEII